MLFYVLYAFAFVICNKWLLTYLQGNQRNTKLGNTKFNWRSNPTVSCKWNKRGGPRNTRCMVMPSLMAARWVGQNFGAIFRHLWTKVHQIKFASVCGSVRSLQRHFSIDDVLLRSTDIPDQVAKLCKIAPKFDVFGLPNFGSKGHPNFWPNFINLGHQRTCGKFGDN